MLIGKSFDIETAYTFEGMKKVFCFLFGWLMKKGGGDAQQKELENLKRLCEAREA